MAWPENVKSDFAMMNDEEFNTFLGETEVAFNELERKLLATILSKDTDSVKKVKEELACRTRLLLAGQKENEDRIAISKGTKATN